MLMNNHFHLLRRLSRLLLYVCAVVFVILAVLMSIIRLAISDAGVYRNDIERFASEYLNRTVHIEALDARMDGLTPTLIFKNVKFLDKKNKKVIFDFDEASLGLNVFASVKSGKIVPGDFKLRGIELAVIREKDGRFSIKGVDFEMPASTDPETISDSGEFSEWLFHQVWLDVKDSTIIWIDKKNNNKKITLNNVNIKIRNTKERHQLKLELKLQDTIGRNIKVALDVQGNILDPFDWNGDIYLKANGLHLEKLGLLPGFDGYTIEHGVVDFELWSRWNKGVFENISGDVTTYNLAVKHHETDNLFNARLLSGLFKFVRHNKGWNLDIANFHYMDKKGAWPESNLSIANIKDNNTDDSVFELSADFFRLEDINGFLLKMPFISRKHADLISELSPTGNIYNLDVRFPETGLYEDIHAHAVFSQLGFNPLNQIPGLIGLNGELYFDSNNGWLKLNSNYAVFSYPKMFRQNIEISSLSGLLEINKYNSGWQVKTDKVAITNNDVATESGFLLDIPNNNVAPFMDLQVLFFDGNAANASKYYPVSIMSSGLVDWLDRGIVEGQVTKGQVIFNGNLSDFPFNNSNGQFQVEFSAEQAVIDYQEDWPPARDITLEALFTGKEMMITAPSGVIIDTNVTETKVWIENFHEPLLKINGKADGELKDALYYLVDSPIYPSANDVVKNMRYSGNAHTSIDLQIPLGDVDTEISLSGNIDIDNAAVYMLDEIIDITDINGRLLFTESEQMAKDIHAKIMGNDSIVDVKTRKEIKGQPVVINARGNLDSHKLMSQLGLPAANQTNGMTDWRGSFILPYTTNKISKPARLQVTSDLQGVEIDLPEPLLKAPNTKRDFVFNAQLDKNKAILSLTNTHLISGGMQLNTQSDTLWLEKGFLHFGEGVAQLPDDEVIQITGHLENFRLFPWIKALEQGSEEVTDSFVTLPLVFDMQVLQLAAVEDVNDSERNNADTKQPLQADKVPEIRGKIEHIAYDDVAIGKVEFKTSRLDSGYGMKLDKLLLQGDHLKIDANGMWREYADGHSSKLNLNLSSSDVGKMLTALGFAAIIKGGKANIDGTLTWPDTPADATFSNIEGIFHEKIEDGSIISIDPGAGRLLGLFSLSALPRRLIFDFSDAFGKGLHFDTIEGEVTVEDGSIFINNNVMKSPLALVTIDGRMGLVDRDFDQNIVVVPQGGDALSVMAGGMVFGPQIGAAILLIQKLIGTEVGEAIAMKYHIGGTWEDPVITRLDKPEKENEPDTQPEDQDNEYFL